MDFTLSMGNSVGMWIACLPVLVIVFGQCYLIYRKAKSTTKLVGLSDDEAKTAFRTGLVAAIGPGISGVISIIAMSAVMGGPITLQRVSIIASASTELRASQYTAEAAGVALGGAGFTTQIFDACLWVMALNGCGWLIFCLLFTDKMSIVTNKVSGGSQALMGAFAASAVLATIMYMSSQYLTNTIQGKGAANLVALISGAVGRIILDQIAKKVPKLKAWNFGLALLVGMVGGAVFAAMTA